MVPGWDVYDSALVHMFAGCDLPTSLTLLYNILLAQHLTATNSL